jgi:cytochrome b subunit of formate dehydrogenase
LIIVSFFGLVLTGMPLAFRGYDWARWLYELFGGYPTAGFIHRICALITFFAAFIHFVFLFVCISVQKKKGFFWGPNSLLIQPRDIFDIVCDIKWFLGIGKRPDFDRWIYWEKFEYLSLMWGTLVMAVTGLILWFPVQFTKIIPVTVASIIDLPSIALIIHRYEAILAAGFIFTIHFFHTHLLPEKMPVDEAIFTGAITEEEFKHERLVHYKRLESQRQLQNYEVAPPSLFVTFLTRLFAIPVLITGLVMVGFMFSALIVWVL